MKREGTLHIVRVSPQSAHSVGNAKYRIGFADYESPGGALKTKELVGEAAVANFLQSVGIQGDIIQTTLAGLRTDGAANILSIVISDEKLMQGGLQDVNRGKDMVDFGVRMLKSQGHHVLAVVREDGTMWFQIDQRLLISWQQMHDISLGKYSLEKLEEYFKREQEMFAVRFMVFNEREGPVLSYCIAGPFVPATFSNAGPRYRDTAHLVESLNRAGLPGTEIANLSDKVFHVSGAKLHFLGLKLPGE